MELDGACDSEDEKFYRSLIRERYAPPIRRRKKPVTGPTSNYLQDLAIRAAEEAAEDKENTGAHPT